MEGQLSMPSKARSSVLIENDSNLLLIERIKSSNGVYYVLPGGGIEQDETPEMAAIREMKEELGVDIVIDSTDKINNSSDRETYIVRATIIDGVEPVWQELHKQLPDNQYRAVWFPVSEIHSISVYPAELVQLLDSEIN